MSDIEQEAVLDPIYGAEIKNYPSDRGRLLLIGGALYFTISFVVNMAFASVEAATAAIIVIGTMALLAVVIGWFILHLWNREVILYERGFSYREGSRTIFFLYSEVVSIKQEAERVAYFGGLIRRTITRMTIKTKEDETIVLDRIYRRVEELSVRLEGLINRAKRPIVEAKLAQGSEVAFGETLYLTPTGIKLEDRHLLWEDFKGYRIGDGKLHLDTVTSAEWGNVPLMALENTTLLLEILQNHKL